MPPSGDVAVVIPAKNESDRIQATVAGAGGLPGGDLGIVGDDGSADDTAEPASGAGAVVIGHSRSRGRAAAMETGAEAVRLLETAEAPGTAGPARHLLFLDGDLGASAAEAGPLIAPVRTGDADMTIAVFADRARQGGHGFVVGLSGAGIERATGWRAAPPPQGAGCPPRGALRTRPPPAARVAGGTRRPPPPGGPGGGGGRSPGSPPPPAPRPPPAIPGCPAPASSPTSPGPWPYGQSRSARACPAPGAPDARRGSPGSGEPMGS